jgi:hypothetical protein
VRSAVGSVARVCRLTPLCRGQHYGFYLFFTTGRGGSVSLITGQPGTPVRGPPPCQLKNSLIGNPGTFSRRWYPRTCSTKKSRWHSSAPSTPSSHVAGAHARTPTCRTSRPGPARGQGAARRTSHKLSRMSGRRRSCTGPCRCVGAPRSEEPAWGRHLRRRPRSTRPRSTRWRARQSRPTVRHRAQHAHAWERAACSSAAKCMLVCTPSGTV